ncbi:hypothetical protein [Ekhidna sp. To15]|uniref:hypothetical protein n=1 Tax=Ekhidna sp. To15 TaxID=3395267 RepID=UPI003F51E119
MQRILIPLFFVLALHANAQISCQLYVDSEEFDKIEFDDTTKLINHVNEKLIDWIDAGYYFSGLDSVKTDLSIVSIFLHRGKKMKTKSSSFRGTRLHAHLKRQLKEYANSGYPFATIRFDSASLSQKTMTGNLVVETGPEINYDSAYFFTDLKTNHSYIYQLLDVVPEEPYSERGYRLISRKIERSSFLSLQRSTDLAFKDNKAKTFLDIKEDASSSFQGVIGLQQVQNGKTTAVGALELDIQNLFRSGKQFKFAWEKYAKQSQNLSMFYKHPFILDSKISPSFNFELLKQDTTFLSRKTSVGIHTFVAPRVEILLEYESTNGTLLSTSLEALRSSGLADFKRKIYGVQLSKGHLSALGERKSAVVWDLSFSAGKKTISRNLSIPDNYYDSIQTESNFYRLQASLAYQLKISKRQSFFHHIKNGTLQNDELLQNELYRIGGLSSLRGFNEKDFFVKSYLLSRVEFRSFFEDRSYAYVFYDYLFFSNGSQSDQPFGLGLGFALATSAGQFSFALAVGRSDAQQISFSNMKAHFGYISRF